MTLWEYMNTEHGLSLLDSEIHDILELARQEIELPDDEEVLNDVYTPTFMWSKDTEGWVLATAEWFRDKVRNPYPKTIRFKEDPEEFFKK